MYLLKVTSVYAYRPCTLEDIHNTTPPTSHAHSTDIKQTCLLDVRPP